MDNWRKAVKLARFELSIGAAHFLLVFFISIFISIIIGMTLNGYLTNQSIGFDFFFIILFSIFPAWFKPEAAQYKRVSGELWASHIFIMYKQLPIPEDIIVKNRFIIHFMYSLPMLILILCLSFLITSIVQPILTPLEYVSFSIIWLSFSIYIGLIMGASDAGDRVNAKTMTLAFFHIGAFFTTLLGLFHFVFAIGIVYWTIILAENQTLIAALISILLSIIGIRYWQFFMKKTIKKMDYF